MPEEIEAGSGTPEQPAEVPPEFIEAYSAIRERAPEKFKDPVAFVKSYSELERRLTETGTEKNNLEAQLEDLYGRMQTMEQSRQTPAYDPAADPMLLAYEQAMENGDYRAALAINQGLTQAQVQQAMSSAKPAEPARDWETWAWQAEQTAIQKIGDREEYERYKGEINAWASKINWENMTSAQAGDTLVELYEAVKGRDVLNNHQTVAEQQAEADRQAKLAAQTMAGSSGRPPQPTRDEAATAAIIKAAHSGTYQDLISG